MIQVVAIGILLKGISFLKELSWVHFLPYGEEMQWYVYFFTWVGATHGLFVNSFLANLIPKLNLFFSQGHTIQGVSLYLCRGLMLYSLAIYAFTIVVFNWFYPYSLNEKLFFVFLLPYIFLNPFCQLARVERSLSESFRIDAFAPSILTLSLFFVPILVTYGQTNLLLALATGYSMGLIVESTIHYLKLKSYCGLPSDSVLQEPFFKHSFGYAPGAVAFNVLPAAEVSILKYCGYSVEIVAYYYAMKFVTPLYGICSSIVNYLVLPLVLKRKSLLPGLNGLFLVTVVSLMVSMVLGRVMSYLQGVPGLETWLYWIWLVPPLWYTRHLLLSCVAAKCVVGKSQKLNALVNLLPVLFLYPTVKLAGPVGIVYSLVIAYFMTGIFLWRDACNLVKN